MYVTYQYVLCMFADHTWYHRWNCMQQHIQTHDLRMCSEPLNILIERWSSYEQLQATKPPKTNKKCYNMYTQK